MLKFAKFPVNFAKFAKVSPHLEKRFKTARHKNQVGIKPKLLFIAITIDYFEEEAQKLTSGSLKPR